MESSKMWPNSLQVQHVCRLSTLATNIHTWLRNPYPVNVSVFQLPGFQFTVLPLNCEDIRNSCTRTVKDERKVSRVMQMWGFCHVWSKNKSNTARSKNSKHRNWSIFLEFLHGYDLVMNSDVHRKVQNSAPGVIPYAVWHAVNTPRLQSKWSRHCVRKNTQDAYSWLFILAPGVTQTVLKTESEAASPASHNCVW